MTLTAGTISQTSVGSTTASLAVTAASGGTGPYTNQWYRSTTSGFSPGGGNIISGATALTLDDTGLVPGTIYYYKVVQTDTGDSNATVTATQLAVTTSPADLSQNQFQMNPLLGTLDMKVGPTNVVSVEIDTTQATSLYFGQAVKMYDRAGGVPKVVGCTADTDNALGFIVFDLKTVAFAAGARAEVAMAGSCMFLYATEAIARGAQVVLDVSTRGGVAAASGSGSERIVGWAFDKAAAMGDLIRVMLTTPSFEVDA